MAKTKWFRVASSGPTIDGREITPEQIDQMARNYDPEKYGARIWIEHFRSMLPESPFKAYGDVLKLKADDAGDGKRVLLAQVDVTEDLLALVAKRQKCFFSIEMDPAFAGGAEAYLVGLAVTDSPASLSTEMMRFSLSSDKAPATIKNHAFSEGVEAMILPEEDAEKSSLFRRVKELLSAGQGKADARTTALERIAEEIAKDVGVLKSKVDGFGSGGGQDTALSATVAKLSADIAVLSARIETTGPTPPRQPHAGGDANLTDC